MVIPRADRAFNPSNVESGTQLHGVGICFVSPASSWAKNAAGTGGTKRPDEQAGTPLVPPFPDGKSFSKA
jgi:hypothetical protein